MIYTVYGHQTSSPSTETVDQLDSLKAVPEGSATWALIAPPIWLIVHRLWWPLTFCLLYWVFCLALLATAFAPATPFLIGLPGLYLMLEGRELYRRKLESQGLGLLGLVEATSEQSAIGRFLEGQPSPVRSPATPNVPNQPVKSPQLSKSSASSEPVFGLFTPRES